METQQKVINIGLLLVIIAGFTTMIVLDDEGIELEPTHHCESRWIKMYCVRTTSQYCYPSLDSSLGSKRCVEGWKEIPEDIPVDIPEDITNLLPEINVRDYPANSRFVCSKIGCV